MQLALSPRVKLGGSYRGGATYEGERLLAFPANEVVTAVATFRTPSSWAAGIAADVTPDFTAAAPVAAGETGAFSGSFPTALVQTDTNNISPRIGVAWAAPKSFVVRSSVCPNPTSPPVHVPVASGPRNAMKSVIRRSSRPFTGAPSRLKSPTNPLTTV